MESGWLGAYLKMRASCIMYAMQTNAATLQDWIMAPERSHGWEVSYEP